MQGISIKVLTSITFSCLLTAGVFADSADDALTLAQTTLTYVEKSVEQPEMATELTQLAKQLPQVKEVQARKKLEQDIRQLRRKILFSHPDLNFEKMIATQRGIPYGYAPHMVDQYVGRFSRPGPGLVVISNWKSKPHKTEPLKGKMPHGTVLNPDLHWDGNRVLFSFCDHSAPPPAAAKGLKVPTVLGDKTRDANADIIRKLDPDNPLFKDKAKPFDPTPVAHLRYFIWEAAIDGSWVRQITGTPSDPMETWEGRQTSLIEDVDPCYLPDGGFVFTSTRSQNYGRCHWGRYTPAFLLYRANGDGSNIHQISYGEANEWEPAVLNDGRIAYTRWDYINRNAVWYQSLWTTKPDGTGTAHFYGNYTMHPGIQTEVKAIPGSHVVVATAGAHHYITAGSLITIDTRKGEDGPAPITRLTPEVPWPESEGWNLPGCYAAPYPINDTLFLTSFSPEPWAGAPQYGAWPSKKAFGIWLVDTMGGRELIYQDPDINTFTPIPVRKQKRPPVIPSVLPERDKAPDTGFCYVDNVYDSRIKLEKGSIKYLRLNQLFNQPSAKKCNRHAGLDLEIYKRPLGVVPVAEDGSVNFRMPAEVPVQLQALNAEGMAVFTMRSFIYVQRGETLGCVGCHEDKMKGSRPQQMATSRKVSDPQPEIDLGYKGPFSFMQSVQPVLDRHCIGCHGLKPAGKDGKKPMSLIGSQAAQNLIEKKQVTLAESYKETGASTLNDYFATASPLTALLKKGHHDVKLSKDELAALVLWMDLNAPQYSDGFYGFNRPEQRKPDATGEKQLRAAIQTRFGKAVAEQPFAALVNVGKPEKSRILLAALPTDKGGWGQLEAGFKGLEAPEYKAMQKLVKGSIKALAYHDFHGTCGRGKDCICNSCWIWMGEYNLTQQNRNKADFK
ncbi:MAG: hypothetical protein PF904_03305 [Kiritimatiellae bacterium]|jgi:hypothetical protein|nr:hypothetical protein [Kiritimatiellia bacterium]